MSQSGLRVHVFLKCILLVVYDVVSWLSGGLHGAERPMTPKIIYFPGSCGSPACQADIGQHFLVPNTQPPLSTHACVSMLSLTSRSAYSSNGGRRTPRERSKTKRYIQLGSSKSLLSAGGYKGCAVNPRGRKLTTRLVVRRKISSALLAWIMYLACRCMLFGASRPNAISSRQGRVRPTQQQHVCGHPHARLRTSHHDCLCCTPLGYFVIQR